MRYVLLGLGLLAPPANARPVTYPGGSMGMAEANGSSVLVQVDHTLSRKVAVGAYALTEGGGDRRSVGLVANYLAMRRNTADSQANLYLMTGAGPSWVRRGGGRDAVGSGWLAAEADWETRRWFVGGMAKASLVGDDLQGGYRLRAGVAPYLANSGALHTWLFVQVDRAAERGRRAEVAPVLRLFRGPLLVEAGVSDRGRGFGTLWFYF